MSDYHEPPEKLSAQAKDYHRALLSLQEEIEAVDWYNQRVELCENAELKAILAHNRDEEIEHACMVLEWLRRRTPVWDENLKKFLFREGAIHSEGAEAGRTDADSGHIPPAAGLGIGSLKEVG